MNEQISWLACFCLECGWKGFGLENKTEYHAELNPYELSCTLGLHSDVTCNPNRLVFPLLMLLQIFS